MGQLGGKQGQQQVKWQVRTESAGGSAHLIEQTYHMMRFKPKPFCPICLPVENISSLWGLELSGELQLCWRLDAMLQRRTSSGAVRKHLL